MLIERVELVTVLAPLNDRFAGTVHSAAVDATKADKIAFLVSLGAATGGTATGTAVVTVEKCTDKTGAGAVAIPFIFKKNVTPLKDDYGALTKTADATGITVGPGINLMYEIEVSSRDLDVTHGFVRITGVEGVDDPVDGVIVACLSEFKFSNDMQAVPA